MSSTCFLISDKARCFSQSERALYGNFIIITDKSHALHSSQKQYILLLCNALEFLLFNHNHKNYNFLACDWFKNVLFSTNSLAKLLSDSLLLDSLLLDSLLSDSLISQSLSKMQFKSTNHIFFNVGMPKCFQNSVDRRDLMSIRSGQTMNKI